MRKISIILFCYLCCSCFCQNQGNIWYFGDHAGLNFNNGGPIPITNGSTYNDPFYGSEGTATISDSSGQLLFYTNGQQVWNKNHQTMPNGNGLLGNISSTQSSLIVPLPGSSTYFYLFTVDDFYNDSLKYGFRYSVIDMCLSNGSGDILSSQKNIKILDSVTEKITAVRHSNGMDYWIIIHKYYSDAFYSYRLSSLGITDTIRSNIGSRHPNINGSQGMAQAIGQMKAAPNGKKLAIVNGNAGNYGIAEYFDFDATTGVVSNWVNIQTNGAYQYYGVSFSPDNSKLYISCWLNDNGIFQFDMTAGGGNSDSVKASRVKVSNATHYALQLGPNKKIYLAPSGNSNYLSTINYPNSPGANCGFQDSSIFLNGKVAGMGLPNFMDSYDYSNGSFSCFNEILPLDNAGDITLYPNPTYDSFTVTSNEELLSIEVLTAIGEIVTETLNFGTTMTIDLSQVNPGLYFCKMKTIKGERILKVVKGY